MNLISWTFALYLAGSISAAASISLLVAKLWPEVHHDPHRAGVQLRLRASSRLAPNMPVLLVGRVCCRALGGGGLIALVYVSQDRFFPNHLVPRTIAFLSSVWMMAFFCRAGDRRCLCHHW